MEKTITKPKLLTFKGKPLIEIPKFIPQVGFLKEGFGLAFLKEYKGRVNTDYNGNYVLNVLTYSHNVVKGSNPFAVVLANQILREEGLRTATQADLEKVLKLDILPLRGTYEDTGLVLRSRDEPNKYLAKNFPTFFPFDFTYSTKLVGKRPIIIPLNGLELVNDSNSPHGLTFNLIDGTEIIRAPVLDGKNNGRLFSETGKYGLPEKLGKGNRTLYTRDSGLSRLYLTRYLDLLSDDDGLADSSDVGRVVVVRDEATSPKDK